MRGPHPTVAVENDTETRQGAIRRDSVDVAGEDDVRVYYREAFDGTVVAPPMPSVSEIKSIRVDPDKEASLSGWRDAFDGQDPWSRPWWKDQMMFKAHRGTLVHFHLLSLIGDTASDTYFHDIGPSAYGYEEYHSEYCLRKWSKQAPSASEDTIPTPPNNKYDGEHAWDKTVRDVSWALNKFETWWDTRNTVLETETYGYSQEHGFGGQYDLLYKRADGTTVLCDLKTSSDIRFDHKLQLAAYGLLCDYDIDQYLVLRIDPSNQAVTTSANEHIPVTGNDASAPTDVWDRTANGLQHQFLGLADEWRVQYADVDLSVE